MYLHDRPALFQFVLKGKLSGDPVQSLKHAWDTALSVIGNKELIIDVSGVTDADSSGVALLARMQQSGARLTAPQSRQPAEFLRSLGVVMPRSAERRDDSWALRFLRLAGLCG